LLELASFSKSKSESAFSPVKKTAKKLAKPTKEQIARTRKYINSMDWEFSRSMPQWPHWYVLKEDGSVREFDFVARLIKRFGYPDAWGARTDYYLVIGKFKYWAIDNVLNRATPISNAEMRKRGLRYAAHHGKKIGPYGRLISIKKKRARR